jgi:hypothetical protein
LYLWRCRGYCNLPAYFTPSDLSTRSDLHPSLQTQSLLAKEQPDDHIRRQFYKANGYKSEKKATVIRDKDAKVRLGPTVPDRLCARQSSRRLACAFLRLITNVAMRHWNMCVGHTGDRIQPQDRCIRDLQEQAVFEHIIWDICLVVRIGKAGRRL